MSACEHKTEEETAVCNRCTAFRNIAYAAKKMLDARKTYMDQLIIDPRTSDEAQEILQNRVKELERLVKWATDAKLWGD